VLSYTGLVALYVAVLSTFQIFHRSRIIGKYYFFQLLNKLNGKVAILLPFRIISVLFLIAWLALALPFADLFIGTNLISSFTEENGYTGIKTWFGTITDQNNAGAYYFGTVLFSILGVRGFWLLKMVAEILTNDTLAVSNLGKWGGTKDFKR